MATVMMVSGAGCVEQRGEEISYVPPTNIERYENHMELDGQWGSSNNTGANGQYGIGDPFVMRYNGKYYLYPSTSDPCDGIKVFESDDMVNWTYKGFAVAEEETTVHGAYAPEVVYYNGYFYMCQSRAGKGHYIYRSESPTEGFTLVSTTDGMDSSELNYGNLGMGIDGAFFVADDGKLYLMHTSTPAGLKYNEIKDVNNICADTLGPTRVLGDANLKHWIEGPGTFRRGEYTYLTYTGNHVGSKGYRVAYSYAKNLKNLSSFAQPTENVTLIDTDPDHYGLGHSSNFNGPDLDSVYTAYHSLVGRGPARRYNLERYFAFGSTVTANGVTHRPVAMPATPTAKVQNGAGLAAQGDMFTLGQTAAYFTAEYNFVPSSNQKLLFGVNGENGYEILLDGQTVVLYKNGSKIGEKTATYPYDKLNTVRVENGDGVGYIYLNGMRVISYEAESAAGYIGYSARAGVEFTAFTNDVFGTSDFEALKNFPTKFPAVSYLKEENRGFSFGSNAKVVKGGIRVGEKQTVKEIGDAYAVTLKKNDWVKYAIDVDESGLYSIGATVSLESDATIKITIDGKSIEKKITKAQESNGYEGTVKVSLGQIQAEKGVTSMKVEVLKGEADIVSYDVEKACEGVDFGDESLALFTAESGKSEYSQESGLAVTQTTTPTASLLQEDRLADFEMSATFTISADLNSDFGIMLRAKYYSYYKAQASQSWQGYYLKIAPQMITLKRFDYGEDILQAKRTSDLTTGAHTLTVRMTGNRYEIHLDGQKIIEGKDDHAFLCGKVGFYSSLGTLTVQKFSCKTI